MQPPAHLPHGRPGRTLLECLDGGPAWRLTPLALARLPQRAAVATYHWLVTLPHAGNGRWRLTRADGTLRTELLAHALLEDGTAVSVRFHAAPPAVPDALVADSEMQAWGALLEGGLVARAWLVCNRTFGPVTLARVADVNATLDAAGVPAARRITVFDIGPLDDV